MRSSYVLFMLFSTLMIGLFFLSRVPTSQERYISALETRIADMDATIAVLEVGTVAPPSPTPDQTLNAGLLVTPSPTASLSPTAFVPLTSGARVVQVEAALSVDDAGCALNPADLYTATDTIYGVATFADMNAGDVIQVSFTSEGEGLVIYEDTFTVSEPGSFCRWYTVAPDELGWTPGTYTISYTVNENPAVTISYTVQ